MGEQTIFNKKSADKLSQIQKNLNKKQKDLDKWNNKLSEWETRVIQREKIINKELSEMDEEIYKLLSK